MATRNVMWEYFALYEPELIHQRKACRLLRHWFWAAGVNNIWTVDQHDKWKWFGLALHTGIEPFLGRILWMKVWHLNQNLQLILTYYLEVVEKLGCKLVVKCPQPQILTSSSCSIGHTEQSWNRKFWNHKCSDDASPVA